MSHLFFTAFTVHNSRKVIIDISYFKENEFGKLTQNVQIPQAAQLVSRKERVQIGPKKFEIGEKICQKSFEKVFKTD